MSPTQQNHPRLPIELYRPIIEEIQDSPTLLSLLTTSKIFNHEAERKLYRNLNIRAVYLSKRERSLVTRLVRCEYIASYVHSLRVDAPRSGESEWLRNALKAMHNLKILRIEDRPLEGGAVSIENLVQGVTFQLHTLSTTLLPDRHFKAFIQSQPKIKTLIWHITTAWCPTPASIYAESQFFSPSDLPLLTNVSASKTMTGSLLSSRPIARLTIDHMFKKVGPSRVFESVEVLRLRELEIENMSIISMAFPNLRFLEGNIYGEFRPFTAGSEGQLNHLEKMKLYWTYGDATGRGDYVRRLASYLFSRHPILAIVEVRAFMGESWRMTRAFEDDDLVPEIEYCWDVEEWMRW